MEEKPRFRLSRTALLNLATIYAVVVWAARDFVDQVFCLACIAIFYGCVIALQVSHRAALADLSDDEDDAEEPSPPSREVRGAF